MNYKHWQESKFQKTTINNCGVFAIGRLVDPLVGISTICLLFLLINFIAPHL